MHRRSFRFAEEVFLFALDLTRDIEKMCGGADRMKKIPTLFVRVFENHKKVDRSRARHPVFRKCWGKEG